MRGAAATLSSPCVQVWRGTVEESRHAVDSAVVTFALSLQALASAFARLSDPARRTEIAPSTMGAVRTELTLERA